MIERKEYTLIDYQMPPTQYFENYKPNIEKWHFRGAVGEKRLESDEM